MRLLPLLALVALLAASGAHAQRHDAPAAAVDAALAHVQGRGAALGLKAADTRDLAVASAHVSRRSGLAHVYVQQRVGGVEVRGALVSVAVAPDGRVASAAGELVSGLDAPVSKMAALTPQAALAQAARLVGEDAARLLAGSLAAETAPGAERRTTFGEVHGDAVTARLVYVPTERDGLRLAWEVVLPTAGAQHVWDVLLDAATGAEIARHDRVVHDRWPAPPEASASASGAAHALADLAPVAASVARGPAALLPSPGAAPGYRVYPMPLESPGHAATLPPADGRSLVSGAEDPAASPFGWHDTNGEAGAEYTITRGNNVHAYQDRANDNSGAAADSPDGGAALAFDFPLDFGQNPSTYTDAATVNLFYWSNVVHDVMYRYGFDEAAGNFQRNTYGRGGAGGDEVRAEAQDGGGTDNANFYTPADGSRPRMQMYEWTTASPRIDGDFDAGIVAHEYGHGISIRLTGGRANVSCLNNAEQMGEGWSDFFGLVLTMDADDTRGQRRGIGTYALNQSPSGGGIRPAPYSTDFGVNPYTYQDSRTAYVPHGVGFVWATALWEMTWDLVDAHGFSPDLYDASGGAGNQIALALVTEGLKLQPCSPGFVDGRDAILAADAALYPDTNEPGRGLHHDLLWGAFARRGLGFSASQGSTNANGDNTEAFDSPLPPPAASVAPQAVAATAPAGASTTATVTVANTAAPGSQALTYSATLQNLSQPLAKASAVPMAAAARREAPAPAGRLAVRRAAKRADLVGGSSPANLAGGPDAFGYVFADSDEPGGPAASFQDISASGAALSWTAASIYAAADEGYADVALPFAFPFYGAERTSVRVFTNGFLTFTGLAGDTYANGAIPSPEAPNALIAPFWDDLDPSSGGAVYAGTLPDGRFAVQYDAVPRYGTADRQTFQVLLALDGSIEFQYGAMTGTLTSATVGIEGDSGADGVGIVRNGEYVASAKAVRFSQLLLWASAGPAAGSVAPGASREITLTLDATDLPEGVYTADLAVATNDPAAPSAVVPITFTVGSASGPAPIVMAAPEAGAVLTAGEGATIAWDPGDVDPATPVALSLASPTAGTTPIATVPNSGSFAWTVPAAQEAAADYRVVLAYEASGEAVTAQTQAFEILAAPSRPIAITAPTEGDAFANGERTTVRWDTGDVPSDAPLRFLLDTGDRVRTIRTGVPNAGRFTARVPRSFAPGTGYRLLIEYAHPETGATVRVASGAFSITPPEAALAKGAAGAVLALAPVQPNPVRGHARVAFSLAAAGDARVTVHDVRGREVAVLARGRHELGSHSAAWASGDAAPGVYVVRLQTGTEVLTQRAVVVR